MYSDSVPLQEVVTRAVGHARTLRWRGRDALCGRCPRVARCRLVTISRRGMILGGGMMMEDSDRAADVFVCLFAA